MPYTMSVIVSRAIPEIDGLKPSHRKLLYMMYKMGLLTGPRRKSADVVGQTMQLNPHGEMAIYETLVRLTRANDALLHPLVDSKGSFGKHYSRDMAFAASRYTEVKLDAICAELFRDIDKDSVDFIDNYNGLMKEPVLLPSAYPNILTTPNQGIAVGMASRICSFNLREVCEAAIAYIKNPKTDLTKILLAPDFSTGGELIYNENEINAIYETGEGSFKLRAKYRYDKKNSCIEVYEIPYTTTIEAIIDKIAAMVKSGKLKDVTDVRDETDLNGLKIAIDIRRSSDHEVVMQRLFAQTTLMDSFSCNFNILVNGRPRTLGVAGILEEWLNFRTNCVKRRVAYELAGNKAKLNLLLGLEKVLLDIDKAIRIIRGTETEAMVIPNLMEGFDINKEQAEFIAEIRLRNLNHEYLLKRVNERDTLEKDIAGLTAALADPKKIGAIITAELRDIMKKHGKDRRTEIVRGAAPVLPAADLVEDYPLRMFLTAHSYLKKIPLSSLRMSGEHYLKEGDAVIQELDSTNKTELLLFSDKQNVYKIKCHEITDCKTSSMGEFTVNLLDAAEGERIVYMAPAGDYTGFMLFAFNNGKIAKVSMEAYATKQNRRKLINAYSDKAALVFAALIPEDTDFLAMRNNDKAMLFNTSLINPVTTKNSIGVQVFTLKKNSALSQVMTAERASAKFADPEYYRVDSIPSAGHFLSVKDK
ncbi:MAG: topoisomerase IV [Clostridiales bacterium]|nr:topoisomerase IV [Clostridiales bacterium]